MTYSLCTTRVDNRKEVYRPNTSCDNARHALITFFVVGTLALGAWYNVHFALCGNLTPFVSACLAGAALNALVLSGAIAKRNNQPVRIERRSIKVPHLPVAPPSPLKPANPPRTPLKVLDPKVALPPLADIPHTPANPIKPEPKHVEPAPVDNKPTKAEAKPLASPAQSEPQTPAPAKPQEPKVEAKNAETKPPKVPPSPAPLAAPATPAAKPAGVETAKEPSTSLTRERQGSFPSVSTKGNSSKATANHSFDPTAAAETLAKQMNKKNKFESLIPANLADRRRLFEALGTHKIEHGMKPLLLFQAQQTIEAWNTAEQNDHVSCLTVIIGHSGCTPDKTKKICKALQDQYKKNKTSEVKEVIAILQPPKANAKK